MTRFSFIRSAIVGFLISLTTWALYLPLSISLGTYSAIALSCSAATLAYLLFLLSNSESRFGRVTVVVLFCLSSMTLLLLSPPISVFALVNITFIWVARACYFHQRVLVALVDLVITTLSFAVAIAAAMQSQSVFIAFWCFFLLQSMILPAINYGLTWLSSDRLSSGRLGHAGNTDPAHPQNGCSKRDDFNRAHRQAEAALSRLTQKL